MDGLCLAASEDLTRAAAVERFAGQVRLDHELGAVVILGGVRGRLGASRCDGEQRGTGGVEAIRSCTWNLATAPASR